MVLDTNVKKSKKKTVGKILILGILALTVKKIISSTKKGEK